ncbi:hypothetical protein [Microcoleus sp. CAWBG58]|uniref:hypothetical protein n=1 Tax=Microcoleus sp. CAWBG58 TaxID=2841651 RepID=UPI0025CD0B9A|nr:hypothetical protein [Microcoleus sp. CAWBG58]
MIRSEFKSPLLSLRCQQSTVNSQQSTVHHTAFIRTTFGFYRKNSSLRSIANLILSS